MAWGFLGMKWRDANILSIDTETTGLRPGAARIVEVGAYSAASNVRFGQLLNPGIPIPAGASAVHGIFDVSVANKPRLVDVADDLLARIRDVEVLVGYNWPFDHGMLEAELGKRWLDTIEGKPVLDPLVLARMEWPGRGGHGLGQVAKKLELARKGQAHRASSDAQLACEVLFKLGHHLSEDAHEASQQIVAARIGQDKKRKQYWG